jgi:hypothetical protein
MAPRQQGLGQGLRVGDTLLAIDTEAGAFGFLQGNSQRGNHVHVWTTLQRGKDSPVDTLR